MRSSISQAPKSEDVLHTLDWTQMFEAIGHPALVLDPQYAVLQANRATLEKTGLQSDQVIGKKCFEIFKNSAVPCDTCPMQMMVESGHFELLEMEVELLGGWYMISCTPVFNQSSELTKIIHIATDFSRQKDAEKRLAKELDEKNVLLREIHHRVKNNLQVISSLINLQAYKMDDPRLRSAFKETQNRIRSMALIHQELYQVTDFTAIPLEAYIEKMVYHLYKAYSLDPSAVEIDIVTEPIKLSLDLAMPLGLIINELIANVFKYAFPDDSYRPGRVVIQLSEENEGILHLMVKDNGVGLPETLDIHHTSSFGMHLLVLLVEDQLCGQISERREAGTEFHITFPLDADQ